jgi:hypothetical protein
VSSTPAYDQLALRAVQKQRSKCNDCKYVPCLLPILTLECNYQVEKFIKRFSLSFGPLVDRTKDKNWRKL